MTGDRSQSLRRVGFDPGEKEPESVSDWRRMERARQAHEEAFERLLGRCRALEDEKVEWVDRSAKDRADIDAMAAARASVEDRLRAAVDRVQDLEATDLRRRDAEAAERDRMADAHALALAEVETREEAARHDLAKAEETFRIEAYRLSALVVLRSKQAEAAAAGTEAAAAEAAAARHQLALLVASTSWRLTRPLRVLSRLIRRAGRAPHRLARALRSRS